MMSFRAVHGRWSRRLLTLGLATAVLATIGFVPTPRGDHECMETGHSHQTRVDTYGGGPQISSTSSQDCPHCPDTQCSTLAPCASLDTDGLLGSVEVPTLVSNHEFLFAVTRDRLTSAFFQPDLPPPKLS